MSDEGLRVRVTGGLDPHDARKPRVAIAVGDDPKDVFMFDPTTALELAYDIIEQAYLATANSGAYQLLQKYGVNPEEIPINPREGRKKDVPKVDWGFDDDAFRN